MSTHSFHFTRRAAWLAPPVAVQAPVVVQQPAPAVVQQPAPAVVRPTSGAPAAVVQTPVAVEVPAVVQTPAVVAAPVAVEAPVPVVAEAAETVVVAPVPPAVNTMAATAAGVLADETLSAPTCVYLDPARSFLWATATNNAVSLPVVFPKGATSATLSVAGVRYAATYENVAAGDFTLTLPKAGSPESENVYSLTLAFDDGTVRTAKLGLVEGFEAGASASARVRTETGGAKWRNVWRHAIMPVPYGVTAFSVQVEGRAPITATGLDGSAGWFAVTVPSGRTAALAMEDADGTPFAASLRGLGGIVLSVR